MFGSLYSVSLPEGLEREGERGKYLGVDYDILRQWGRCETYSVR